MSNESRGIHVVDEGLRSHWYAVQTRPRHEKKVSAELTAKDIRCFLPVVPRCSQWSDRRRIVDEPLFAGYLFVRFPLRSRTRIALLQTSGVVGLVGGCGSGTPIPEGEIYAIQQILERRVPIEAHEFLTVGERVRIRGGALDGLEGILQSFKGDQSLVVSIETIQRSIAVTISGYHIIPIRDSHKPGDSLGVATSTN